MSRKRQNVLPRNVLRAKEQQNGHGMYPYFITSLRSLVPPSLANLNLDPYTSSRMVMHGNSVFSEGDSYATLAGLEMEER